MDDLLLSFKKLEWKHQLLIAATIGAIASSSALLTIQSILKLRQKRGLILDADEIDWNFDSEQKSSSSKEGQEDLINEQLSRNIAFLGMEGTMKLRNSFVIVVGLGGVGSHAAHMLVRAGVERIRLIDFDQVTLSSLNRHAVATRNDVGIPKVTAMKLHLLKTVPYCQIDSRVQLFKLDDADELLSGNPDYVLDCIDHLPTKIELIEYCLKHKLNVISSMGAGAKSDPSRIQIAGINETFEDPLARSVRQKLKKNNVHQNVTVVYSSEKPGNVKLLPLEEEKVAEADQFSALPTFRSRILPVLGTIPALFGNAMASYVITELAGFKTEPLPIKGSKKLFERFYKELVDEERSKDGDNTKVYLNAHDLGYIYEDTWQARSALSRTVNLQLILIRWDPTKNADFGNMICLTKQEAAQHKKLAPEQFDTHYGAEFIAFVKERFEKEAKARADWR